jgi:hypothetical protein
MLQSVSTSHFWKSWKKKSIRPMNLSFWDVFLYYMLKDCTKVQGHRLWIVSRKKFNTNIGSDTFYNAEIAVEGDLKTQLSEVLKNKISTPQTSNLADTFSDMYLRFVPDGSIICEIFLPRSGLTSPIVYYTFFNVNDSHSGSAISTLNFRKFSKKKYQFYRHPLWRQHFYICCWCLCKVSRS